MRSLARVIVAFVIFSVCCLVSTEARADPLVIDSGSVTHQGFSGGDPVYNFAGPEISVMNRLGELYLHFGDIAGPGSTINLSGHSFGGGGPVVLNGVTYNVAFGGELQFSAPNFVLPTEPLDGSLLTITTPFTMTGRLVGCTVNLLFCEQRHVVFDVTLSGQGLVTGTFRVPPARFTPYSIVNVAYNFQPAPVPEPTTLLLFGAGLAGVAARVRRRRKDLK